MSKTLKYTLVIGFIMFAILGGVLKASAYDNEIEILQNYARANTNASRAISNVRKINEDGIQLVVSFPDKTTTKIILRQRSQAINPDESVQLFTLPGNNRIIRDTRNFSNYASNSNSVIFHSEIFEPGIRKFIQQSLDEKIFEPAPASYRLIKGSVSTTPHKRGVDVDIENALGLVKNNLIHLSPNQINIEATSTLPNITEEGLIDHIDFVKSLNNWRGVYLTYNGYKIRLLGRDFIELVRFDPLGSISIDSEAFRAKLRLYVGPLIDKPAILPQFAVVNGKIKTKVTGSEGQDINIDEITNHITEYLSSHLDDFKNANTWPLPKYELSTTKHEALLTEKRLRELGINSYLGTAKISFKGSSKDRIHNIKLGASRVTGTIIYPGEEFSLVSAIGYTATTTGYKEEYVIKQNRSRKEAGGGLCQVATTFFRAVLDAGLMVTERHNHSYIVGYYGPGLDAGIYDINYDFRFINDTNNPILIQSYIEANDMVVELLGKNDGRKSITTKPIETRKINPPEPQYFFSTSVHFGKTECTDKPRKGMTTYATTTVTYADGRERVRVWKSVYTPWPKICIIGTNGLNIFQVDD